MIEVRRSTESDCDRPIGSRDITKYNVVYLGASWVDAVRNGSGVMFCNEPRRRSEVQRLATAATTSTVPTPPATTAVTGPSQAAVRPDSSPPSSLEEPMKTWFTAETR